MARLLLPASLALAFAFGVVGAAVGLNALIESSRDISHLHDVVPSSATLEVDISDAHDSGIVLTVFCLLIAVTSVLAIGHHFVFASRISPKGSGLARKILGGLLALWTVGLFATLVPFTMFFAQREAQVKAFIGGKAIPQSILDSVQKSIGATTVYKDLWYLRLLAIIPWFTLLFSAIATAVLFKAARSHTTARNGSLSSDDEKARIEHVQA